MKAVRFLKRFDFRPSASVVMAYAEGQEAEVTEAVFAAAAEAGAVEVINVKGPKSRAAASKDGGPAEAGKGADRAGD